MGRAQKCEILLESVPRFEKRIFGELRNKDALKQIPRSRSDSFPYVYDTYAGSGINTNMLKVLHVELLQGPGCESYPYLEMDEGCKYNIRDPI